ncbi:hypothetical protein G7L65_24270, partial [Shigella sonnei]|uniref:hypothetical protein n=1 Tax=Shigella sonnei TaxID=624 RepID=UPI0014941833
PDEGAPRVVGRDGRDRGRLVLVGTTGDVVGSGEVDADANLGPGWHLASSNYDISSHSRRDLAADVNWATYGFGDGDDD